VGAGKSSRRKDPRIQRSEAPHFEIPRRALGRCERSRGRTAHSQSQLASDMSMAAAIENSGSAKFLQSVRAGVYRSRSQAMLQALSGHQQMLKSEADTCQRALGDLSTDNLGPDGTEDLKGRTGNFGDCPCCHRKSIAEALTRRVHPLDSAQHERPASSALRGSEDLVCTAKTRESRENPEGLLPNTTAAMSLS
jgi:hypothetical protein